MPKVSIIMPTYNVEKYFRKCLESVINQTLTDIEIIPVDDGSPDNCGAIMDEYAVKDERIKPIHKENGGYGCAVNTGIEAATGEYIGIVETDDWCEPQMFEKLYTKAKQFDADVAKCDFSYYYGGNRYRQCHAIEKIGKENCVFTIKENPKIMSHHVSIWSAIYRKSYLDKYNIRLEESRSASYQDMPFAVLVYAKGAKITLLHDHLINYRAEEGMNSSTIRTDSRLKMMPIQCGIAKKYFLENNCWEEVKEVAYKHFFDCSVQMWYQTDEKYKPEHYAELRKLFANIPNENVKLTYFSKKKKKILYYIINDEYEKLLNYSKRKKFREKIQSFRRKLLSIHLKSDEKYIYFLGKLIWRAK